MVRKDIPLTPELEANYRQWMREHGEEAKGLNYISDDGRSASEWTPSERASYERWLYATDETGSGITFTEEDEDVSTRQRAEHVGSLDVITRFLLDRGFVNQKRQAHLLQLLCVAVMAFVVGVALWFVR